MEKRLYDTSLQICGTDIAKNDFDKIVVKVDEALRNLVNYVQNEPLKSVFR